MRLIVTGFAQHGKDTVCEMLRDRYGMRFQSSSYFVAETAVRPYLEKHGIVYLSLKAMYADRVNHRPLWKKAIEEYNTPDASRLGRELFDAGNDIYCGLREIRELKALSQLRMLSEITHFSITAGSPNLEMGGYTKSYLDYTIWVDALWRKPAEPATSITIKQSDCMFTLDNNGTLDDLSKNVDAMWKFLTQGKLT